MSLRNFSEGPRFSIGPFQKVQAEVIYFLSLVGKNKMPPSLSPPMARPWWLIVSKAFEISINKTQTESPFVKAFSSFLIFLQDNVDSHLTFKNQLCNLIVSQSYRTLFVYIGFSQRFLIHAIKDLWAYSSLSLTDLVLITTYDTHCFLLPFMFFLHSLRLLHINDFETNTFLVELMTQLSYNVIHQSVEYCCVSTTAVMNPFFFFMNPFSFFWSLFSGDNYI